MSQTVEEAFRHISNAKMEGFNNKIRWLIKQVEDVFILRNSSLKLKTVADNANLRNYAVSSKNISERIKIKTENDFHLKQNVCKFRRNKKCPDK